jgi:hypothetical protein
VPTPKPARKLFIPKDLLAGHCAGNATRFSESTKTHTGFCEEMAMREAALMAHDFSGLSIF